MDLSIIIVSWNTQDLLKKCLDSIYRYQAGLSLEILVVDNNSIDGTVAMIKDEYLQVKLIANNKNLGFARANNQAIKLATGEYILLLNPDTEILPNSLETTVKFMADHPHCGALGARLLNHDQTLQPSVRNFPTFWPIFLMLIKAPKIFKHLKPIEHYLKTDFNYNKLQPVDQIMGAFMLIPKKVFSDIGLLDERFFIWFEEVDLCQRIKKSGQQVIYNPAVAVIHHGGSSFRQTAVVKKQWLFFISALKYFLKYGFFNH